MGLYLLPEPVMQSCSFKVTRGAHYFLGPLAFCLSRERAKGQDPHPQMQTAGKEFPGEASLSAAEVGPNLTGGTGGRGALAVRWWHWCPASQAASGWTSLGVPATAVKNSIHFRTPCRGSHLDNAKVRHCLPVKPGPSTSLQELN